MKKSSASVAKIISQLYDRYRAPLYLGGALGALSVAMGPLPRRDERPESTDPTLDLPSAGSLRSMMIASEQKPVGEEEDEKDEEEKSAGALAELGRRAMGKEAQSDESIDLGLGKYNRAALSAALVGAPLLGFYLGRKIPQALTYDEEDELSEAERDLQKALMAERMVALRAQEAPGGLRRLPAKTAQAEEGGKETWVETASRPIAKMLPYYGAYALPAALIAGIVAHDKFKDESEERKRYRVAKDMIQRRLMTQMPQARFANIEEDEQMRRLAMEAIEEAGIS